MTNAPTTVAPPSLYGWDWSATTHDGRQDIVNDLLSAMGTRIALPGKGLQGWGASVEGYDEHGYKLGSVFYGGGRDDVHVVSTSEVADLTRGKVLGFDQGRTARVDTRVDTLVPFEDLTGMCEQVAAGYGSRLTFMGSWQAGEERNSGGRTLYVGSPSSAVRVRVYEKWLESPGQYVEGCNRVEVQLRPKSNVKDRVSAWSPSQTFCASRVTRALAGMLGDDMAPVASLHVKKDTPDLERTLRVMGEQYGPSVDKWLKLSGGDMDRVLAHLLEGPSS